MSGRHLRLAGSSLLVLGLVVIVYRGPDYLAGNRYYGCGQETVSWGPLRADDPLSGTTRSVTFCPTYATEWMAVAVILVVGGSVGYLEGSRRSRRANQSLTEC